MEKPGVFIAFLQKVLKNIVFSLLFEIDAAVDEEPVSPGRRLVWAPKGHRLVRQRTNIDNEASEPAAVASGPSPFGARAHNTNSSYKLYFNTSRTEAWVTSQQSHLI